MAHRYRRLRVVRARRAGRDSCFSRGGCVSMAHVHHDMQAQRAVSELSATWQLSLVLRSGKRGLCTLRRSTPRASHACLPRHTTASDAASRAVNEQDVANVKHAINSCLCYDV